MPVIRPARHEEGNALHALWERTVRASHHFLAEEDIAYYSPMVRECLASGMEFWVAADDGGRAPLAFMGLDWSDLEVCWKLEALFVDPDLARRGLGALLVRHARLLKGPLILDVNEQNPRAIAFYRKQGFAETGRSSLDGAGRPFPLLHMRS